MGVFVCVVLIVTYLLGKVKKKEKEIQDYRLKKDNNTEMFK